MIVTRTPNGDVFDHGFTKVYHGFVLQYCNDDLTWKVYNANDVEVGKTDNPGNFPAMIDHWRSVAAGSRR